MKIHTKVVIDMASGEVLEDDWFDYEGPIASCDPITAAIGVGGSLLSGILSGDAAEDAANISAGAARSQIGESRRQFDLVRGDTQPYRDVGQNALFRLSDLFGARPPSTLSSAEQEELATLQGLSKDSMEPASFDQAGYDAALKRWRRENPSTRSDTTDSLTRPKPPSSLRDIFNRPPVALTDAQKARLSLLEGRGESVGDVPVNALNTDPSSILSMMPGYQFRLDQNQQALERNQSKYRFTPRAAKELSRFSQGFASGEFGNVVESLFRLSGLGGSAVNTSAAAGANAGNQINSAYGNMGVNQGNAAIAGAAGMNNAIQGGLNNYTTLQMYNRMFPQPHPNAGVLNHNSNYDWQ